MQSKQQHIQSAAQQQTAPENLLHSHLTGQLGNHGHTHETNGHIDHGGVFDHYLIQDDGTPYLISHCDGFGFLGDLAFCCRQPKNRYQEVIETVRAVELPLEPLRSTLENDNRFLRFLIDTMAQRMTLSLNTRVCDGSAEQAILAYMRWRCPNQTITNVSEAAFHTNFSRRQVQRVLKNLTGQGILIHSGKGRYELRQTSQQ